MWPRPWWPWPWWPWPFGRPSVFSGPARCAAPIAPTSSDHRGRHTGRGAVADLQPILESTAKSTRREPPAGTSTCLGLSGSVLDRVAACGQAHAVVAGRVRRRADSRRARAREAKRDPGGRDRARPLRRAGTARPAGDCAEEDAPAPSGRATAAAHQQHRDKDDQELHPGIVGKRRGRPEAAPSDSAGLEASGRDRGRGGRGHRPGSSPRCPASASRRRGSRLQWPPPVHVGSRFDGWIARCMIS